MFLFFEERAMRESPTACGDCGVGNIWVYFQGQVLPCSGNVVCVGRLLKTWWFHNVCVYQLIVLYSLKKFKKNLAVVAPVAVDECLRLGGKNFCLL